MQPAINILKSFWGYSSFRPMQEDIIHAVLEGKDVLALLPTGGGKSICFQVPAMMKDGLCLVISPLIALMKDQVENLRKKGITAFAIYSGMSRKEVINTLKIAGNSNCKFLYVSPERLETALFKEYLPSLGINLLAIDEAHCISQWGYDFRPPYLRIAALREELPSVPVLALTASATPEVQEDICVRLGFRERNIFRQSFERPNLSYSVFRVESPINKIVEILSNVAGSSIVYCRSRKKTKEIAGLLNMHGLSADFYHAGLGQEERSRRQEAWIRNQTRIIVCTNAFGMGIDKPDVRSVIHADIPDCLENYYQEAGRAGRDGMRSYAVLLYDDKSIEELEKLPETRYPPIEQIRKVYQSLMNFLQLPAGSGGDTYYDFDITDFMGRFGYNAALVTASLKTLEQEDYLAFNEQVFLPARLQFTCDKDTLYAFEQDQPQLEPIIKTLLRTYEGIFDFPASIHEGSIAWQLSIDPNQCRRQLMELQHYRIVAYQPMKDKPQLFFFRNRVSAADLHINAAYYLQRKKQFTERMEELISYVRKERICRSRMIASYFGDDNVRDCGICDNCLRNRKKPLSAEEFEKIRFRIFEILSERPAMIQLLIDEMKAEGKEKTWQVIDFLQAEDKINVDQSGWIRLKK